MKRDRIFSTVLSWYYLDKTMGVGQCQGAALDHALSGGMEAKWTP